MRIGEFAKLLGISDQTLRNYEKKGILIPKKLPSGYRYYDETHIKEAIKLGILSPDRGGDRYE